MEWLTQSEALALAPALFGNTQPQAITVQADTELLPVEIPKQPRMISPDEGPPSEVKEWYGRIKDRLVVLRCMAKTREKHSSVEIKTGFLQHPALGDWSVLHELQGLPSSVNLRRPLFVESRSKQPCYVVFRPQVQGWKIPVYKAEYWQEARSFLEFLSADEWNRGCFIADPEPTGRWVILHAESDAEYIMGPSSELWCVLKTACDMSLLSDDPSTVLRVKDLSGANSQIFRISLGRLL